MNGTTIADIAQCEYVRDHGISTDAVSDEMAKTEFECDEHAQNAAEFDRYFRAYSRVGRRNCNGILTIVTTLTTVNCSATAAGKFTDSLPGNIILAFTTGYDSVFGTIPAPCGGTGSIANIAKNLSVKIDLDGSYILNGQSLDEMGEIAFQTLLRLASSHKSNPSSTELKLTNH